ncbi:TraK domain-containing protein [Duganella vulcania]|uniref:TraK C-terminal domain-containing protein n=1 Tax=Duganella vulcania TaxID=2692166 RepID=A0A845GHE3_9BURK|nr:type-F conjugative transfer system secretin TraK [Duganella vulcania]MYM92716.1 hypothetical protein [Duganella vulcania]
MKNILSFLLLTLALDAGAQSQTGDSAQPRGRGGKAVPVETTPAAGQQAHAASVVSKAEDSQAPAVKTGGSIGMTSGATVAVKRKAGGMQVVTSTIGGDGSSPDEKAFGAATPASAVTGAAAGSQAQVPSQIRALLESPGFQQKLLAGAASQSARRDAVPAMDQRDAKSDGPLVVVPGVVEVVPIAKGFLNRIVTPFENPRVYTINQLDTTVDGNVVYVSTKADQADGPIGIYIQDNTEGADDAAIALSLTPMDIPARELRVKFGGRAGASFGSKSAEKWETSQPYVSSIKEVLKSIALNKLPQGYGLSSTDGVQVRCEMPGFASRLGQVIDGHNFRVVVFAFRNVTNMTREITEQACYRKGVAAVSAWPTAVLEPNQETEVFVVTRADVSDREDSAPARPSVINKQR